MPDIHDDILAAAGLSAPTTAKAPRSSYDGFIEDSASRHGVDPDLIRAQMGQESSFKPGATSPKGASGLMQLMPATAQRFGVTNIYDPKQNIEGGTKYMKLLLDRFNGNVDLALAGYNAGEGAVDKYKGIPPFHETQDYVKRIRSNYQGSGYHPQGDTELVDHILSQVGSPQTDDILSASGLTDAKAPTQPSPTVIGGGHVHNIIPESAPLPGEGYLHRAIPASAPAPPSQTGYLHNIIPESSTATPTPPVPEKPETLEAQRQAANDPASTRAAVLYTPGEQPPQRAEQEVDIPLADGSVLRANGAKLHGFVQENPDLIKNLIAGKADFTPLIGGKAQPTNDTASKHVVVTRDKKGNELVASSVESPEAVLTEAGLQKAQFPNHDTETFVSNSDTVAQSRVAQVPHNPVTPLMNEVNRQKAQAALRSQETPIPVPTDADFKAANDYQASQGQPAITREQFDAAQKSGSVNANVDPNDSYNQAAEAARQDNERRLATPPAEAHSDNEILSKGAAATVPVDFSKAKGDPNRYAVREAIKGAQAQYGIDDATVEKWLNQSNPADYLNSPISAEDINAAKNKTGNVTITNATVNDLLKFAKGDTGDTIHPELRANIGMQNAQTDRSPEVPTTGEARWVTAANGKRYQIAADERLPSFGEFVDQMTGDRTADNKLTPERQASLDYRTKFDPDTASRLDEIAGGIQNSLLTSGNGIGNTAAARFAGSMVTDLAHLFGGANDLVGKIAPPVTALSDAASDFLFGKKPGDLLGRAGNQVELVSKNSTPDYAAYKIAGEAGDFAGKLPGYAIAGLATGGNPVMTFALHDALVESGRGGSIANAAVAGAKGGAMGLMIGGVGRFGKMASNGLFDAIDANMLKVTPKVEWSPSVDPSVSKAITKIWQASDILERGGPEAENAKALIEKRLQTSGLDLETVLKAKPGSGTAADSSAAANELAKQLALKDAGGITDAVEGLTGRTIAKKIVEGGIKIGLASGVGYGIAAAEGGSTQDKLKNALLFGVMEIFGVAFHKGEGERLTESEINKADGSVVKVPDEAGKSHDVLLLKNEKGDLEATDVTGKVPPEAVQGVVLPKPEGPKPSPTNGETLLSSTKLRPEDTVAPGQPVTIEGKGPGVIVEDKGKNVVVDHTPKTDKNGETVYQGRSTVRKPNVSINQDETNTEIPSQPASVDAPPLVPNKSGKASAQVTAESAPAGSPDATAATGSQNAIAAEPPTEKPASQAKEVVPKETPRVQGIQLSEKGATSVTSATPEGETHDFSSTQANLPKEAAKKVLDVGKQLIPDEEVYHDPNDSSYGREETPHVTVKYGLHTNDASEVANILADEKPFTAKLGKISIFKGEGDTPYDVVKADVDSPELHALNKKIAGNTKVTDTFPTYVPHVTLAYVKKGEGAKYVGNRELEGTPIDVKSITFSGKDRSMTDIPLGVKPESKVAEKVATTKPSTPIRERTLKGASALFPSRAETPTVSKPAKNKPPKAAPIRSLSQFVRANGGIKSNKYDSGEANRIRNKETGTTGLVNNKSGLTAHNMSERAWEAGYLRDHWQTMQDIDGNQLMEHVENDLHGIQKHYPAEHYENIETSIADQEREYREKQAADETKMEEYRNERDDVLNRQVGLLNDPAAQKVLDNVSKKGYDAGDYFFPTPNNEESKQYHDLLERYGISTDYARDTLEAYESHRSSTESESGDVEHSVERNTPRADEKGVSPKPNSFDQTDLFGNKTTPQTEQRGMFDNAPETQDQRDRAERKTADYISDLTESENPKVARVASEISKVWTRQMGTDTRPLFETAADALGIYANAQQTQSKVADILKQQNLEGKTTEEQFGSQAVKFAKAMEGGVFGTAFANALAEAKAPVKSSPAAKPKIETAPAENFQDYGEKIGGAKKDIYQRLEQIDTADLKSEPLSKVFPRPDFAELVKADDITLTAAKFLNFIYDQIPSKPRKSYKVAGWVGTVNGAIDTFRTVLGSKGDDAFLKLWREKAPQHLQNGFATYSAWLDATGFPETVKSMQGYEIKRFDRWKDMKSGELQPPVYSIVKGPYIIGDYPTAKDAAEALKTRLDEPTKTQFNVYQDRKTNEYFLGKKGAKGVVRLVTGFKSLAEARKYHTENADKLEEIWESKKYKAGIERKSSSDEIREAKDWRQGKDIASTKEFADTFGFKGVEFGNWVKQGAGKNERQQAINDAYDSLMDLSELLDVPPKALSLNGQLSLALGARGSGQASAHYERDKIVINLTKTRGKGSLAHEWWHGLDNYFSRMRGEKTGMVTEFPAVRKIKDSGLYIDDPRVRKELLDGYAGVLKAVRESGLPTRSNNLDATRTQPYWSTKPEMTARAFENYVIDRLGDKGQRNDYLANFREMGEWAKHGLDADAFPYPTKEEAPKINEAFDSLFKVMEAHEADDGNVALRSVPDDLTTVRIKLSKFISRWLNGEVRSSEYEKVLEKTPEVYQRLGFSNSPFILRGRLLSKTFDEKHANEGITRKQIERLALDLNDPVAIFPYTDQRTGIDGVNVLTSMTNALGDPIVAGVVHNSLAGRLEVHELKTIHGKTSTALEWLKNPLFVNKEKATLLATTVPKIGKVVQQATRPNTNILTEGDLVKKGNDPLRSVPDIEGKLFERRPVLIDELIKRDSDLQDYIKKVNPEPNDEIGEPIVLMVKPRGGIIHEGMQRIAQAISNGQRTIEAYVEAGQPLLRKIRTPEAVDELHQLSKTDDFSQILPRVMTTVTDNNLWLDTPESAEVARTLLSFVNDNPRRSEPVLDGLFLEPGNVAKFTEAADAFADAAEENGVDAGPIRDLLSNIEKASEKNGTVKLKVFDDTHEDIHEGSYLGADGKSFERRYANSEDLKADPDFQQFHKALNRIQGKSSHGVAMEEALAYLGNGEYERFGLNELQAVGILHKLVSGYAAANGVESLKNFEPNTKLYETIETYLKGQSSKTGDDGGGELGDQRGTGLGSPEKELDGDGAPQREEAPDATAADNEPETGRQLTDDEHIAEITGQTVEEVQTKNRKFARSLATHLFDVGDVPYSPQTEKGWQANSESILEAKGLDGAIEHYRKMPAGKSEGQKTALGVAIATELYAQDRITDLTAFGKELTENIGNAAQELRASALLARLNPAFAQITGDKVTDKAHGRPMTDEERQKTDDLARKLEEAADNHAFTQAALEESERMAGELAKTAENLEKMLTEEKRRASKAEKRNEPLQDALKKAKQSVSYYKSLVEDKRAQRIYAPKTRKQLVELKKTIDANRPDLVKLLQEKFPGTPLRMVAWHGSPHTFDKFDSSKIGTGEGAQAYGHGLYFAGEESIADFYREKLSHSVSIPGNPVGGSRNQVKGQTFPSGRNGHMALDAANEIDSYLGSRRLQGEDPENYGSYKRQADFLRTRIDNTFRYWRDGQNSKSGAAGEDMAELESFWYSVMDAPPAHISETPKGAKYRVDLKPDADEYLLWDKPLSEQSEKVRKGLRGLLEDYNAADVITMYDRKTLLKDIKSETGGGFYNALTEVFGVPPKQLSDDMKAFGVRGIKYLDGSSRHQPDQVRRDLIAANEELRLHKDSLAHHESQLKRRGDSPTLQDQIASAKRYIKETEVRIAELEAYQPNFNYVIFDHNDVEIQEVLRSVATPDDLSIDKDTLDALTQLGAAKLIEGLPTGLTIKQFDSWLDGITNDELSAREMTTIHALAYEMTRPEGKETSVEAKKLIHNRLEHAKRANLAINSEKIAANKAMKDAAREVQKAKVKSGEAYRDDKFANAVLDMAEKMDTPDDAVFMAFAQRETPNPRTLQEIYSEAYPDSTPKDFTNALESGKKLLDMTKDGITSQKWQAKAGTNATAKEVEDMKRGILEQATEERLARKALENHFRKLEQSNTGKALGWVSSIYNLPRSVMFAGDFGFLLAQGAPTLVTHPSAWWKAVKTGIPPAMETPLLNRTLQRMNMLEKGEGVSSYARAIPGVDAALIKLGFTGDKFEQAITKLYESEARKRLEGGGAKFETIGNNADFNDEFMSDIAKHIPIVRQTNLAHSITTDLYRLYGGEADLKELDQMYESGKLTAHEYNRSKEFITQKWANVMSGKGYLGKLSPAAMPAAQVFSAPRYVVSAFQIPYYANPFRAAFLPKGARKIMMKNSLKMWGALLAGMGLLSYLGVINDDPEDKDFMQIDAGKLLGIKDLKINPIRALKEPLRLTVGLGLKKMYYMLTGNKEGSERINKEYYAQMITDPYGQLGAFWKSKLHPTISIGLMLKSGKNYVGEPLQWTDVAPLPLPIKEVYQASVYDHKQAILKTGADSGKFTDNWQRVAATAVSSMIGFGANSYPASDSTTAQKQAQSMMAGGDDRTEEQKAQSQKANQFERLIREGVDVSEDIKAAISTNQITSKQAAALAKTLADDIGNFESTYGVKLTDDQKTVLTNNRRALKILDYLWGQNFKVDWKKIDASVKFATKAENTLNDRAAQAEAEAIVLESLLRSTRITGQGVGTDDVVEMYNAREDKMTDDEKAHLREVLTKKAQSAQKSGTLTEDEVARIKTVLPDINIVARVKERKERK